MSYNVSDEEAKIICSTVLILKNIANQFAEKNDSNYIVISITPFTMIACIFLRIFKKKPNVYLRSDGHQEYKSIVGFLGPVIYHVMFLVVSKISHLNIMI